MATSKPTIIFSAPQAWGKTRNAEALRREFGCRQVIDDWEDHMPTTPGALHLTNLPPTYLRTCVTHKARVVTRGW